MKFQFVVENFVAHYARFSLFQSTKTTKGKMRILTTIRVWHQRCWQHEKTSDLKQTAWETDWTFSLYHPNRQEFLEETYFSWISAGLITFGLAKHVGSYVKIWLILGCTPHKQTKLLFFNFSSFPTTRQSLAPLDIPPRLHRYNVNHQLLLPFVPCTELNRIHYHVTSSSFCLLTA